jgi:hypothetical protein
MRKYSVYLILVLFLLLITGCSDSIMQSVGREIQDQVSNIQQANNEYVQMVKNGYIENNPDLTFGVAFENFFASPTWKHFEAETGQNIVEFTGDCTYLDTPVKARLQFILSDDDGTFEIGALSFNEVPQTELVKTALFIAIFDNDDEEENDITWNDIAKEADLQVTEPPNEIPAATESPMAVIEFDVVGTWHGIGAYYGQDGYNNAFYFDDMTFSLYVKGMGFLFGTYSVNSQDGSVRCEVIDGDFNIDNNDFILLYEDYCLVYNGTSLKELFGNAVFVLLDDDADYSAYVWDEDDYYDYSWEDNTIGNNPSVQVESGISRDGYSLFVGQQVILEANTYRYLGTITKINQFNKDMIDVSWTHVRRGNNWINLDANGKGTDGHTYTQSGSNLNAKNLIADIERFR